MKKIFFSALLFAGVFAVTYLFLCYGIPGWRIKLAASPMVYFVESLKSLALIKTGHLLGGRRHGRQPARYPPKMKKALPAGRAFSYNFPNFFR